MLGAFFDLQLIDEVHVFTAAKLLGGADAKSPLAGTGRSAPSDLSDLDTPEIEVLDGLKQGYEIVTGRYKVLRSLKSGTPVKRDNTPESEAEKS